MTNILIFSLKLDKYRYKNNEIMFHECIVKGLSAQEVYRFPESRVISLIQAVELEYLEASTYTNLSHWDLKSER